MELAIQRALRLYGAACLEPGLRAASPDRTLAQAARAVGVAGR